jgi:hypothetical protein
MQRSSTLALVQFPTYYRPSIRFADCCLRCHWQPCLQPPPFRVSTYTPDVSNSVCSTSLVVPPIVRPGRGIRGKSAVVVISALTQMPSGAFYRGQCDQVHTPAADAVVLTCWYVYVWLASLINVNIC